jgi:hypothetical protein
MDVPALEPSASSTMDASPPTTSERLSGDTPDSAEEPMPEAALPSADAPSLDLADNEVLMILPPGASGGVGTPTKFRVQSSCNLMQLKEFMLRNDQPCANLTFAALYIFDLDAGEVYTSSPDNELSNFHDVCPGQRFVLRLFEEHTRAAATALRDSAVCNMAGSSQLQEGHTYSILPYDWWLEFDNWVRDGVPLDNTCDVLAVRVLGFLEGFNFAAEPTSHVHNITVDTITMGAQGWVAVPYSDEAGHRLAGGAYNVFQRHNFDLARIPNRFSTHIREQVRIR